MPRARHDPVDEAIELLLEKHATPAERDERTIRLVAPRQG